MNIRRTRGKRVSLAVSIVILIVLLSCIFINSLQGDKAKAAVINNADTISTDLLLSTRVDSNVGGKVFNTLALQELYAKLAGENANFDAVEDNAREAKSTYSNTSVKSMHSGMDSG